MATYRVFPVEQGRHSGAPTTIDCADDAAAIEYARKLADGRAVEVWQRERFVHRHIRPRQVAQVYGLPSDRRTPRRDAR